MMTPESNTSHQNSTNQSDQSAYFATKQHQIQAHHLMHKIHIPINPDSHYSQYIDEYFAQIKTQGYANPILIGAIPFDTSRQGTLNFYRDFEQSVPNISAPIATQTAVPPSHVMHHQPLVPRQAFEQTVEQALIALANEDIQKIVLSQAIEYQLSQTHAIEQLFNVLIQQNPAAYNFVIPIEHNQYIFGASPELLLSKQQKHIRSNPLAGSRPRPENTEQQQYIKQQLYQSAKDRHEHQLVVDNIHHNLADYCAEFTVSADPDILETSTMFHLSSEFNGTLKQPLDNVLKLALNLHPTPAVCGTPTSNAKQFILKHEGYDRHYYSGLSGWMDAEGNGEWVVTIRCGLLNHQTIRLYAGAGIVTGSDPTTEWRETEAKMQTMLNVLQAQ